MKRTHSIYDSSYNNYHLMLKNEDWLDFPSDFFHKLFNLTAEKSDVQNAVQYLEKIEEISSDTLKITKLYFRILKSLDQGRSSFLKVAKWAVNYMNSDLKMFSSFAKGLENYPVREDLKEALINTIYHFCSRISYEKYPLNECQNIERFSSKIKVDLCATLSEGDWDQCLISQKDLHLIAKKIAERETAHPLLLQEDIEAIAESICDRLTSHPLQLKVDIKIVNHGFKKGTSLFPKEILQLILNHFRVSSQKVLALVSKSWADGIRASWMNNHSNLAVKDISKFVSFLGGDLSKITVDFSKNLLGVRDFSKIGGDLFRITHFNVSQHAKMNGLEISNILFTLHDYFPHLTHISLPSCSLPDHLNKFSDFKLLTSIDLSGCASTQHKHPHRGPLNLSFVEKCLSLKDLNLRFTNYEKDTLNSPQDKIIRLIRSSGTVWEGIFEKGFFKNDTVGIMAVPRGDYYKGKCLNGKMTTGIYAQMGERGFTYEGEFIEYYPPDKKEATLHYHDGKIYQGYLKKWLLEGQGKMTYPDGRVYDGIFENGSFKNGISTAPGGFICKGIFERNLIKEGMFTHKNGQVYNGIFEKGQIKEGEVAYPDGASYKGTFEHVNEVPKVKFKDGILTEPDGKVTIYENGQIKKMD